MQCPAARRPSHPSHVALRACPASLSLSSFCCACSLGCSCPSTSLFSTRRRYQAPGGVLHQSTWRPQVSGWPHIPPPTYLPQVLVGTRGLCASTRLVFYAPGFGSAASLSLQGISIQPTACDKVLSRLRSASFGPVFCGFVVWAVLRWHPCRFHLSQLGWRNSSTSGSSDRVCMRVRPAACFATACLCAPFLEWPQCNPEELEAPTCYITVRGARARLCASHRSTPPRCSTATFHFPKANSRPFGAFQRPQPLEITARKQAACASETKSSIILQNRIVSRRRRTFASGSPASSSLVRQP